MLIVVKHKHLPVGHARNKPSQWEFFGGFVNREHCTPTATATPKPKALTSGEAGTLSMIQLQAAKACCKGVES